MLTAGELRKRFGFSADKLDRLIKQGLPVKGKGAKRQFDARKVAAWLKAQPKTERRKDGETAKTKPPAPQRSSPEQSPAITAATIAEAAGHLKVAPRTLAGWLTDPSFPGKAGSPGKADGYFPIAEIQRWHLATFGVTARGGGEGDEAAAAAKRLKAQIDCDRAQIELERQLGTLLDATEQERFLRRMIATAKAVLRRGLSRRAGRGPSRAAGFASECGSITRSKLGSGRYDIDRRPWWIPILDAFDDPKCRACRSPRRRKSAKRCR
jgi:hypothetical protein